MKKYASNYLIFSVLTGLLAGCEPEFSNSVGDGPPPDPGSADFWSAVVSAETGSFAAVKAKFD